MLSALHAEGWDLELPEVEAPRCSGRHDFHTNLSWVGCEGGDPRVESQCLRQRLGTGGMQGAAKGWAIDLKMEVTM